jgi:hypothetical protein
MKTHALNIGPDSGRIAASANSFCDSYIGEGSEKRKVDDQQAGGVVLAGTCDVGLSGNVLSGVEPKALGIEGDEPVERVLFSGNVLVDTDSDVELLQKLKGCVVEGNLMDK